MTEKTNNKISSYPLQSLIRPSRFRIIYLPLSLFLCWAVVFYKARAAEAFPWVQLLGITLFVLAVFGLEIVISSSFLPYLAPGVWGFLAGAGVNAVIQGVLNKFQGLNWAFQSPLQWSLGTVLLGFIGSLVFISRSQKVNRIFFSFLSSTSPQENKVKKEAFTGSLLAIIWAVTVFLAAGLMASLAVIQEQYAGMGSPNPLRKPLWFSAGAVIVVLAAAVLARKNISALGFILLPGIVWGLVGAALIRDIFQGVYLLNPEFFLTPEVLEAVLIVNFCYLGISWLNQPVFKKRGRFYF